MERPIILCGLGRVGVRVLEYLQSAGFSVVVIDNRCPSNDSRLGNARLVRGDCQQQEVLQDAGAEKARGVIIAINDDFLNISTALLVRAINPKVRIVVRLFNDNVIENLQNVAPNTFPLSIASLTAPLLAARTLPGQVLGTFRIESSQLERRQISQLTIPPSSQLVGLSLEEVAGKNEVQVLAHLSAGGEENYLGYIDQQRKLQPKDRIVVCGTQAKLTNLVRQTEETFLELRFANKLRRLFRMVRTTFGEVDFLLKLCLLVLVTVLATSTAMFVIFGRETVPNAVYHSVSIMATMADMRENKEELKIFVSGLRFLGAALTAAFTAILTNYLLRASLRGALEVRRIPESGHVIVCGLGRIGYRVVEELIQSEQRVVVIESRNDNNFVPTVRRNGVPVIIGDASVPEVLVQARVATSRALVICTSNDMVNLEIAMLAVKLNAQQKIIPLQSEPHLEELLQRATHIRHAVSVPTLTAPAFVAGLFGDRVQSIFQMQEYLFAVIDILVHLPEEEEAGGSVGSLISHTLQPLSISSVATQFFGQPVWALAIDYRLVPLAVIPADPDLTPPENPMKARLGPGDRLVAILSWPNLERLLRRQPESGQWTVQVNECPSSDKDWLISFLANCKKIPEETAAETVKQLPFSLGTNLTRGQAEHLHALLKDKGVASEVSKGTMDG